MYRSNPRREGQRRGAHDLALVDAVIYAERFVGSRAVWDTNRIREMVLTRVEPGNIGLSSIGRSHCRRANSAGHGLFLQIDSGLGQVLCRWRRGFLPRLAIENSARWAPGDEILGASPRTLCRGADGEREFELVPQRWVTVTAESIAAACGGCTSLLPLLRRPAFPV
ncbi:MAG: hypothetical protein R3E79_20070 [Caldilineaceae bacterium]